MKNNVHYICEKAVVSRTSYFNIICIGDIPFISKFIWQFYTYMRMHNTAGEDTATQ